MADEDTAMRAVEDTIARGDMETVQPKKKAAYEPTYQMSGDTRIPVSKAHGKLWQSRRDQAKSKRRSKNYDKAWAEAIKYYQNDQLDHRDDDTEDGDYAGNESGAMQLRRKFSETENIVFANTSALVPTLYAKNPTAEFTAHDDEDGGIAVMLEKLTNRILSKKSSPGVNLKPKIRKAVVMTTLTNSAYVEIGWTFRDQSSENALDDLTKMSKKLEKARTPDAIRAVEGEIMALEQKVDVLRPSGPWTKFRRPQDVLWDCDETDDAHEDAKWCMIRDWLPTSYLNAAFAKKKGGKLVSIYKPTHVVRANAGKSSDVQHEINNYSLFNDDDKTSAQSYGYDNEESYNKAQRTMVWWVWDKVTQRCLLYSDDDWSWPIWVWDNPYTLQGFFPLYELQFNTDPEETTGKGEVTYYLDQQDSINQINSEMKQARQWARRNLFYDKNKVSKDEVERMLKGDEDVAVGVDVPEGMDLKNMVQSIMPPSMQFVQLFDKSPIFEAIDRISSVQPVMRGVEFKTNTTNQAINQYNSVAQTRTDEKIDQVEDFIGNIAWGIAQLALQFMTEDQVMSLIGRTNATGWENMSAPEIEQRLQMTVVGGSTQKPTSEAKKQQALQMGQVLGQFVNAAPVPVLMTMLHTFRTAFNDVIPDERWQTIIESLEGQAAPPQGQPAEGGPPQQEGGPPAQEGAPQPQQDPIAALEQVIDSMPPEAKEALGAAMAKGVPVREALERIIPAAQGAA